MRVDKAGEEETVDLAVNNSSARKALDRRNYNASGLTAAFTIEHVVGQVERSILSRDISCPDHWMLL